MVSKHFDLFYNHVQSIVASSNILQECNLELYTDLENILHKNVITQLENVLFDKYKVNWQNRMFSQKLEINYELINCLKRFLKQRCI